MARFFVARKDFIETLEQIKQYGNEGICVPFGEYNRTEYRGLERLGCITANYIGDFVHLKYARGFPTGGIAELSAMADA